MKPIYCALVHHPVRDKTGAVVTTAVTNLDVHDLARSARTHALDGYFIVTPITAQRAILDRIVEHWTGGRGKVRVPSRAEAIALVRPADSIESAIAQIQEETGEEPRVVATAANSGGRDVRTFADEREALTTEDRPTLLLFGTGHGLAASVLDHVDVLIEPIFGRDGYNHLSVRAAFAIVLDRLLGQR